jgi:hypothetical protein
MFFGATNVLSQDSLFWEFAHDFEVGQQGSLKHDWGSENVTYLGEVSWKSPSGKELQIRIVTSYRKITEANGFSDQSIIALVKTNHTLIKAYDLVKRQNLPFEIRENTLIYKENGEDVPSPLPVKFSERFCVKGLTCFASIKP